MAMPSRPIATDASILASPSQKRRQEGAFDVASCASRYALTFGEVAILHIGSMEVSKAGAPRRGFTVAELQVAAARAEAEGMRCELVMLSDVLPEALRSGNEAATLVLRAGASLAGGANAADRLLAEQAAVEYDRQFWDGRRKRTLHKRARHNVVFGDEGLEHSDDFRQFTVRAFSDLPRLAEFRAALPRWLGPLAAGLQAEGNHYFEAASGIGFHGDSERRIVICLSLGRSSCLRYHWRLPGSSEHTLPAVDIELRHGDVYVMSEKATGYDWRSRSKVRVVHAAGSNKYIG